MKKLLEKAFFTNYTGKNPHIKKLLNQYFDVFVDQTNCLILRQNGKDFVKTSPVVLDNAYRAFEIQVYEYVTENSGYTFTQDKTNVCSGI